MIRYKDLSPSLRTLVVLGWIMVGIFGLTFLMGLLIGA